MHFHLAYYQPTKIIHTLFLNAEPPIIGLCSCTIYKIYRPIQNIILLLLAYAKACVESFDI